MTTTTVGVLGLGNMGSALARRISRSHPVIGFDISGARREEAQSYGVKTVSSTPALAESVDVLLLSLPSPAISAAALSEIVASRTRPGLLIVETSTVLPADSRRSAAECAEAGIAYIEAAILSGVQPVLDGGTTLLVGGRADEVASSRPVLDSITGSQVHLGDVGSAMAAKVINNLVAHDVYVVLSEAVALAQANGVDIDTLVSLLSGPEAGLLRPLTHRIAERWKEGDFEGGMSVSAATKDSRLALEMAQADHIPLFATQVAHTVYELAMARGFGHLDYSAIATLWGEARRSD